MKVKVFYDYPCPFCKTSLEDISRLSKAFPQVEMDYCPIELHPRPGRRSFGVEILYFLKEEGGDLETYNKAMYDGVFLDGRPPWNLELVLEAATKAGGNSEDVKTALETGAYTESVLKANRLAYEFYGLEAVPAYICGDKKLEAVWGVGVSKEGLKDFLTAVNR